jgi:PAS domain S-box-containing protein
LPDAAKNTHIAQFYDDEAFLAGVVADFLIEGITAREPALLVATPSHTVAFLNALEARQVDVKSLMADGRLTTIDACELLAEFMTGDTPDAAKFEASVGSVVERLLVPGVTSVRVYGEMVEVLCGEGRSEAAVCLEDLWNRLAQRHPFHLLCAYSMANFDRAADADAFRRICKCHDRAIPTGRYLSLPTDQGRAAEVLRLQQRSRSLEREIARQRELEEALREALADRCRAEHELTDFIENAAVGLHRVDTDGRILWANRAELELLGYTQDEYVGRHISEFHEDAAALQTLLDRLARGETVRDFEATLRAKDGSPRYVLVTSNAFVQDDKLVHTRCFTRDITALRRADNIARHLSAIVLSSDDTIVSKDLNGIIKSWNPAAERMFGFTAEEAIGRSIRMIIPPDRQAEEDEVLSRIRRGQSVDHFETIRRRKDGSELAVSLTVSPIIGANGEVIGASKIARDITQRKQIEAERDLLLAREQEARRDAERANRLKDDFLALVSHELRTPIQAIIGWVKIARSLGDPDPKMLRALDVIDRNVRAQVRLIDDLVDAARITTGKLQIASEHVHLHRAVIDAVESVRPAVAAKSLELRLKIEPGAYVVVGDAARLQQVVANLLSNAVKFTTEGRIEVRLTRENGQACIVVRDTGRGIAPEFLPFVFDRFRQAEVGVDRQHSGLGLGLAIVRYLAEAHGGSVSAESEGIDKGSTFSICLPLVDVSDEISQPGMSMDDEGVLLAGLRALVVDDIGDCREVLQFMLEQRGADVRTASSVDEALELCERQSFDILLSDLSMPTRDGFALIHAVRHASAKRLRSAPAIAVTAYGDSASRAEALAAGFDDFLVKPVAADDLISAVTRLLDESKPIVARS